MTGMVAGQIPIAASATSVTSSGNLTGDVTTTGSLVATLATVNSNVGSFQGITVDGKGRVTAASNQNYLTTATAASTYLPLTGGTLSGGTPLLTVNSTASDPFVITVPSGSHSRTTYNITGVRTWRTGCASGDGRFSIADETAASERLVITSAGTCSASSTWAVISDERLKTEVHPYNRGLADILPLEPIVYKWNGKGGVPADGALHYGLSAQQVEQAMPELIREQQYVPQEGQANQEPMTLKTYSPTDLTFALVNAIKELNERIAALEAKP